MNEMIDSVEMSDSLSRLLSGYLKRNKLQVLYYYGSIIIDIRLKYNDIDEKKNRLLKELLNEIGDQVITRSVYDL